MARGRANAYLDLVLLVRIKTASELLSVLFLLSPGTIVDTFRRYLHAVNLVTEGGVNVVCDFIPEEHANLFQRKPFSLGEQVPDGCCSGQWNKDEDYISKSA